MTSLVAVQSLLCVSESCVKLRIGRRLTLSEEACFACQLWKVSVGFMHPTLVDEFLFHVDSLPPHVSYLPRHNIEVFAGQIVIQGMLRLRYEELRLLNSQRRCRQGVEGFDSVALSHRVRHAWFTRGTQGFELYHQSLIIQYRSSLPDQCTLRG
jgi:hypothetical protein